MPEGEAGAEIQAEADSPISWLLLLLATQTGSRKSAVGAGTVINVIN